MAVIFTVNSYFTKALENLGHTVYAVHLPHAGIYSAQQLLQKHLPPAIQPDIFFHAEALSKKIFFSDVHKLPCRTAFWSIDTHLHYSWIMYYARLYDVFLTPHKSFLTHLPAAWQHPNTHRLTQRALPYPWRAHKVRTHAINFVGRLSGTRQQRVNLCKMLQERHGVKHKDNISFTDMMQLYADTRILPNESIANEVNFRLMEGASVGACVISPDVGPDQNCLFEPGKEILIYKDLQDLDHIIARCLREPNFCENIGRAAWERVQKEHLLAHKAQDLCAALFEHIPNIAQKHSQGDFKENFKAHLGDNFGKRTRQDTDDLMFFSLFMAFFSGVITETIWEKELEQTPLEAQADEKHILSKEGIAARESAAESFVAPTTMLPFYAHTYSIAALGILQKLFLTLQAEGKDPHFLPCKEKVYKLFQEADLCLLQKNEAAPQDYLEYKKNLAIACGGAALHYADAARSYFYLRQHEKMCQKPSQPMFSCPLETGVSWITVLIREQKQCLVGSNYVSGCCQTAFDFTFLLREQDVYDMRWVAGMTLLDHVWKHYPAFDQYALSAAKP